MDLKPTEGKVALRFIEEMDDDEKSGAFTVGQPTPSSNDTLLALVVGVGPKVAGIKKGDTVFVESYAKQYGSQIDDGIVICHSGSIVATVTE